MSLATFVRASWCIAVVTLVVTLVYPGRYTRDDGGLYSVLTFSFVWPYYTLIGVMHVLVWLSTLELRWNAQPPHSPEHPSAWSSSA